MNPPPLPKWFNAEVSKASKLLLEQALDIYDPPVEGICKASYRKNDNPLHPIEVKFSNMDVYHIMKVAYSDILQRTFLPDIGVTVPDIDDNLQFWLDCRKKQWKLAREYRKRKRSAESEIQMHPPNLQQQLNNVQPEPTDLKGNLTQQPHLESSPGNFKQVRPEENMPQTGSSENINSQAHSSTQPDLPANESIITSGNSDAPTVAQNTVAHPKQQAQELIKSEPQTVKDISQPYTAAPSPTDGLQLSESTQLLEDASSKSAIGEESSSKSENPTHDLAPCKEDAPYPLSAPQSAAKDEIAPPRVKIASGNEVEKQMKKENNNLASPKETENGQELISDGQEETIPESIEKLAEMKKESKDEHPEPQNNADGWGDDETYEEGMQVTL